MLSPLESSDVVVHDDLLVRPAIEITENCTAIGRPETTPLIRIFGMQCVHARAAVRHGIAQSDPGLRF